MSESKLRSLGIGKRLPKDHLFVSGDALCRMYVREGIVDIDDEQLCHQIVAVFPCEVPGCCETFSSLLEFEMHYNSCHRFICGQCRKPLPSAHFLDLHLLESHDSFFALQAERKPMFQCFVEGCPVISQNIHQRKSHCIEAHNFPHDFRYDQSKQSKKVNHQASAKSKMKYHSGSMLVDEVPKEKPPVMRHFTFGHSKGKMFTKLHPQKKHDMSQDVPSEITTVELMDTLPL